VRETKSIFDNDWQKPSGETRPGRTERVQSGAAPDPRKREESWLAIEKAMDGPSSGRALYLIEEYRVTRPGVMDGELKKLSDAALDRIWWERVRQLCDRRDELRAEIRRLGSEIADETDAEFRKKLEADRSQNEEAVRAVLATLTGEMGYADEEVPNPADEEMLAHLRQHRDSKRYETWSTQVRESAKSQRGALPWERMK
jgi:hypothetical protein